MFRPGFSTQVENQPASSHIFTITHEEQRPDGPAEYTCRPAASPMTRYRRAR